MKTTNQDILPVLFVDFSTIDGNNSTAPSPVAKKPGACRDGAAERDELVRMLAAQPAGAKNDRKAVSQTVMNALYKKAGLGVLSNMLAAYNC